MKIKIAEAMRGRTTYTYDNNGNIISADNISYAYDTQNRLINVVETLATGDMLLATYSYDAQSRRVKKVAFNVTTNFIYDQFSNLIAEADASGNITREYIYLNGRPLAFISLPLPSSAPPQTISGQVSGSCGTIFAWNPKEGILGYVFILSPFFFLVFFQVTRNWRKSGVLLLVVLGASFAVSLVVVHRAKAQETGEKIYYYHNDHLGTPIKLTDQSQNVVWSWQYGPFGEEPLTMNSNTISQNLRFPGQYYDAETGLNYNFHRYYSPKLGRYLQHDPILDSLIYNYSAWLNPGFAPGLAIFALINNPSKLPSYTYGANNPINITDPRGLATLAVGFSGTGGTGPGASGSVMLVFDTQGNIGVLGSAGGGGLAGVGGSINPSVQLTLADNIYQLAGPSVQTGGSVVLGGAEWVIGKGNQGTYQGININFPGLGGYLSGLELHSLLEYATVHGINLEDILNYIKQLIKEKGCS